MDKTKKLKVGDHVVYLDEHRVPHDALVETWWLGGIIDNGVSRACASIEEFGKTYGEHKMPSVNLMYVDSDPSRTDQYGGQKIHHGSVIHGSQQTPPNLGNCWLFASEL